MSGTVTGYPRFARALRSRSFALLWMGQTISALGDGAFLTALAWQVLLLTGSGTAMGLVMIARSIPMILFLLVGGIVADRLPRRLVMLWSDAGRAVVVLLIAGLGWFHWLQFWHLIVLSLFFGFVDGFFTPAYQAIPPQIVESEALPSANALTGLSQQVSLLLGPLIGAGCVSLLGPTAAFAFDGLTFVVSTLCLLTFSLPKVQSSSVQPGLRGVLLDLWEGLRYVIRSTWLWVSILIASAANMISGGALIVALPKLVHDVYASGVWLLGLLTTILAIGTMIAALVVGQGRNLRRRGLLAYSGLLIFSVGLIMFGLPLPHIGEIAVAVLASVLLGFGIMVYQIIWVTVMQELVPADKLGRVTSIDVLVSTCLVPVGYALAGILADHIGPAFVFVAGGVLYFLVVGIALCINEIRQLE